VVKADREQLQTELAARGLELGEAVSVSHMIEAAGFVASFHLMDLPLCFSTSRDVEEGRYDRLQRP
jgi:hypothetical protein